MVAASATKVIADIEVVAEVKTKARSSDGERVRAVKVIDKILRERLQCSRCALDGDIVIWITCHS